MHGTARGRSDGLRQCRRAPLSNAPCRRSAGSPPRSSSTPVGWPPRSVCAPAQLDLDAALEPRGYRLLHRLPRFPEAVIDGIVEHFAGLQKIMRASVGELEEVGGVGDARARSVKDGLARLAEATILDRYA